MTRKLLKNVLLKLMKEGFTDRVIYVDNIPEDLLYDMKHPLKITMRNNEPGTAVWTPDLDKEPVPTLKEHIKASQTGDEGLVFNMANENSRNLLAAVERYVKAQDPMAEFKPAINSVDPSNSAASALALSQVPRVVIPVLSPSASKADAGKATSNLDEIKASLKAEIIAEMEADKKAKASERMAKARAARKAK